jgi:hypothetical protein
LAAAALVLLASSACSKKTYPTITARNPDGGAVHVHGTYNHCPLAIFSAAPDHVSIDRTISLTASASDQNNDPLAYFWDATAGTIDRPTSPVATFRCAAPGAVTITLTVSDNFCSGTASGVVLCQPVDGGAGDGGSADGGGGLDAGGGGGGGGSTGAGGSAMGRGGADGTAGTGGSIGPGGAAGTGNTGRGGASGGAAGGSGGGACLETNPPAAISAECRACLEANDNPTTDGCCRIADAVGLQLCQAASACMRAGGPPVGVCNMMGDVTSCLCGTNQPTCDVAGQANGPCVSQFTAAAARNVVTMTTDSPNPGQVLARYGDPAYALGRAANIHAIAGAFCPAECGF